MSFDGLRWAGSAGLAASFRTAEGGLVGGILSPKTREVRMRIDFEGRTVAVPGGAGALGDAVAGGLRDAGAAVVVPCAPGRPPERPVAGVRYVPDVDLTDEAAAVAFYGALDRLFATVNLAGGFAMGPFTGLSLADLRAQLDINLVTTFLAAREAARRFGDEGGRIVTVIARPALVPTGGMVAYSVAKGAVAALTQSVSEELRGSGILINAVAPSVIDTPANRAAMPGADSSAWPTPVEIAATVVFLASPQNRVTSGGLVPVYGRA